MEGFHKYVTPFLFYKLLYMRWSPIAPRVKFQSLNNLDISSHLTFDTFL